MDFGGLFDPRTDEEAHPDGCRCRGHLYRLTQIEAMAGCGHTLRLGFNPGELLDFVLGWAAIDIYDDDVGSEVRPDTGRMSVP